MLIPASSHAFITYSSLMEPPGWIILVMPAFLASSIASSLGKNASLAQVAPLESPLDFIMAMTIESTLDIWPAPIPTVLVACDRTIAFDLTCFAIFHPKSKDAISSFLGLFFLY